MGVKVNKPFQIAQFVFRIEVGLVEYQCYRYQASAEAKKRSIKIVEVSG